MKLSGGRLKNFNTAAYWRGEFGYFSLPVPFVGKVKVTGGPLIDVVGQARAAKATDWKTQECYNLDAALVSDSLQFCQGLCIARSAIAEADFANTFPAHDTDFEMPNAADMFPDPKVYDAPQTMSSSSSAASSSFSAASPGAASSSASVGGLIITPLKPRRRLADD